MITRATRTILLARCRQHRQELPTQSSPAPPAPPLHVSKLMKASLSNSANSGPDKGDGEDSTSVFNLLKDRITQKIGDRIDISKQNAFKLFGIEEKFSIDRLKLKREMRRLQNLLHPDRFVSGNLKTQVTSLELSAMVNDFYNTLSNPYERGKYLLSLMTSKNLEQLEESLGKIQLDGEFLARMMDISERVQCNNGDRSELTKLAMQLDSEIAELTKKLQKDFEAKRIDSIYKDLAKMKFLANCHASLSDRIGTSDEL